MKIVFGCVRGVPIGGRRLLGFCWLLGLGHVLGLDRCDVRGGAILGHVALLCHGLWRASTINPALEVADLFPDWHLGALQVTDCIVVWMMDVSDRRRLSPSSEGVRVLLTLENGQGTELVCSRQPPTCCRDESGTVPKCKMATGKDMRIVGCPGRFQGSDEKKSDVSRRLIESQWLN